MSRSHDVHVSQAWVDDGVECEPNTTDGDDEEANPSESEPEPTPPPAKKPRAGKSNDDSKAASKCKTEEKSKRKRGRPKKDAVHDSTSGEDFDGCLDSESDASVETKSVKNKAPEGAVRGQFVAKDPRRNVTGTGVTLKKSTARLLTRPSGEVARAMPPDQMVLRPDVNRPDVTAVRPIVPKDLRDLVATDKLASSGMRLLSVDAVCAAYSEAAKQHAEYLAARRRESHFPSWAWSKENSKLFAVETRLRCTHVTNTGHHCDFESNPYKLYEQLEDAPTHHGSRAAPINVSVATHTLLTKTTPDDVLDFFAAAGVPTPASGGASLERLVNKAADDIVELNKAVIQENRVLTEMVIRQADPQQCRDQTRVRVDMLLDGQYNVRCMGRSYSSPASIADVVALENATVLRLPIGYEVYASFLRVLIENRKRHYYFPTATCDLPVQVLEIWRANSWCASSSQVHRAVRTPVRPRPLRESPSRQGGVPRWRKHCSRR